MPHTEQQKMLAGELYDAWDPQLVAMRDRARQLMASYNATRHEDSTRRAELLTQLLGQVGAKAWIEPPFYCDYGTFITLGNDVYINFNCTILDANRVSIGPQTMLGPNVQIYAAYHPVDAAERVKGPEFSAPISIGEQCWIGGAVIICPNVTIGDRTTIGAGSVVTRDIPSDVVAVGNPCRVLRKLT